MQQLNLEIIAAKLEGFEETIISRLIDRAQFYSDLRIYEPGHSGFSGESNRCLFDLRLHYQEKMDSLFGRFCVPEERPFTKGLHPPQREVILPKNNLNIDDYNKVSVTDDVLKGYLKLIPELCHDGDDMQYGSCVEKDVYAVQAIARRIHYGALYVGESKYRTNPELFTSLIEKHDTDSMLENITRKDVEEKIIERIRIKTDKIQETVNRLVRNTIDPDVVAQFYRDTIIPLTKKGELLYLLNRGKD